MENTINQRVDRLIFELRLNKKNFALSIGKEPPVITQMIQGRNKPGFEILESILKTYPQVSSEWLMKGEGEIFKIGTNDTDLERKNTSNGGLEWAKKLIDQLESSLSRSEKENERLWSIIEKAGLGKPKVYPLQTALVGSYALQEAS